MSCKIKVFCTDRRDFATQIREGEIRLNADPKDPNAAMRAAHKFICEYFKLEEAGDKRLIEAALVRTGSYWFQFDRPKSEAGEFSDVIQIYGDRRTVFGGAVIKEAPVVETSEKSLKQRSIELQRQGTEGTKRLFYSDLDVLREPFLSAIFLSRTYTSIGECGQQVRMITLKELEAKL